LLAERTQDIHLCLSSGISKSLAGAALRNRTGLPEVLCEAASRDKDRITCF
jgi:hypothetical protein